MMKKFLPVIGLGLVLSLMAAGCDTKSTAQPQTDDNAIQQSNESDGAMMEDSDEKMESDATKTDSMKNDDKMMESDDSTSK